MAVYRVASPDTCEALYGPRTSLKDVRAWFRTLQQASPKAAAICRIEKRAADDYDYSASLDWEPV